METGTGTAAKPTKRKPSTDSKPEVVTKRTVRDASFTLAPYEDDGDEVEITPTKPVDVDLVSDTTTASRFFLSRTQATSLLACLKAYLGGRGTGTPRSKKK